LAHDVHAHPFLFMLIESQMDLRSISTHFRPNVLIHRRSKTTTDRQWTVRNEKEEKEKKRQILDVWGGKIELVRHTKTRMDEWVFTNGCDFMFVFIVVG
jgi:hypothetical protein